MVSGVCIRRDRIANVYFAERYMYAICSCSSRLILLDFQTVADSLHRLDLAIQLLILFQVGLHEPSHGPDHSFHLCELLFGLLKVSFGVLIGVFHCILVLLMFNSAAIFSLEPEIRRLSEGIDASKFRILSELNFSSQGPRMEPKLGIQT